MSSRRTTRMLLAPTDERWVAFVASVPEANIFHHPAWLGLLAECYGYHPFAIAVCSEEGEIQAGLPLMEVNSLLTGRRWISLPFTDHCYPLFHGDSPPGALWEHLSGLQAEHDIPRVELRGAIPCDGQVHKDNSQVLHVLRLSTDTQRVFDAFDHQVRKKSIARAERDGVIVRRAQDRRDLDTFYALHLETRHRLGVPAQPKRYFELVWQRIVTAQLGFLLLAYINSVPISGAIFLAYKNTMVYKYSASDIDYRRFRANHLLLWTAIRWGCEQGFGLFDFGKTHIDNAGLRDFKDGWGTTESVLTYSALSATSPRRATDRLSGIAANLIPRAPRWVCRVTGELLYRHFA